MLVDFRDLSTVFYLPLGMNLLLWPWFTQNTKTQNKTKTGGGDWVGVGSLPGPVTDFEFILRIRMTWLIFLLSLTPVTVVDVLLLLSSYRIFFSVFCCQDIIRIYKIGLLIYWTYHLRVSYKVYRVDFILDLSLKLMNSNVLSVTNL